ncbi:MAG TPA: metallopeptidase TldD-related protein [Thermoanaerobaculia bacterium]|nr:metallopeptidase TldD-related protein [Thermoanaerobaculia bacterium]
MPFSALDSAAVARALAQLVAGPEDLVDAYFERQEVVAVPPDGEPPGVRIWRDDGLAVRLVREDRSFLASRDEVSRGAFEEALRQVARARPRTMAPLPPLGAGAWPAEDDLTPLKQAPRGVVRQLRERRLAFPLRLTVRRHRRWLQVVSPQLVPAAQAERWYSWQADLPWGTSGGLLAELGRAAAEEMATALAASFRARDAAPPAPGRVPLVLAPAAAAVFLHEAVAHALEVDTLALGGTPQAALGVRLGSAGLDVVDDPAAAPADLRRSSDDEGCAVTARWLLRAGVVEQVLADRLWARRSTALAPGAARRSHRHVPPAPRSLYLRLLPGVATLEELLAAAPGGLFLDAAERGRLDPLGGSFSLRFPHAQRIGEAGLGEPLGPCVLRGRVAELLQRVTAVGAETRVAGAGWCAKGGQRLPVWAEAPALLLAEAEVT